MAGLFRMPKCRLAERPLRCRLLEAAPSDAILEEHGKGGCEVSSEVSNFLSGWSSHATLLSFHRSRRWHLLHLANFP